MKSNWSESSLCFPYILLYNKRIVYLVYLLYTSCCIPPSKIRYWPTARKSDITPLPPCLPNRQWLTPGLNCSNRKWLQPILPPTPPCLNLGLLCSLKDYLPDIHVIHASQKGGHFQGFFPDMPNSHTFNDDILLIRYYLKSELVVFQPDF